MNTIQIKRFAQEARTILKQGVIDRLTSLGFDSNGNVAEKDRPEKGDGFVIFMGGMIPDTTFYDKWTSLYERVQQKGIKEVYEEAAYTWFNRLMAIRIMAKNSFTGPVLEYQSEAVLIPQIVADARRDLYPEMSEADREQLMQLLDDDTQTTEQFRLLITNYCKHNPIIAASFGGVVNYTELLLPVNILSEGGFVDLLNNSTFITDEDYKQSELIGWLYQFYISEKKDEVFASFKKGKKAEAEDIPAATQIFTPNWIVKYMVENTLGRIYLDNNPYATELKDKMKYLVEPSEPTPEEAIFRYESIHQLNIADLSCGSGHILNEAFDLLYDMYIEEGYSRRNTIEDIFQYNLLGIDLDTRAKQLTVFALLMKACQKDNSFLDAHSLPRVFDMSVATRVRKMNTREDAAKLLSDFFMGANKKVIKETIEALELMEQADNLGSIMKFDLSELTRTTIAMRTAEWKESGSSDRNIQTLILAFNIVLALTDKYASIAMNPPYMRSGNMNEELKKYVNSNYPLSKSDLFSVFMEVCFKLTLKKGLMGMINQHSWMFLSSYEKLRSKIFDKHSIVSMLHLGTRTFEELSGEVVQSTTFVIINGNNNHSGTYYRLTQEKNNKQKEISFLKHENVFKSINKNSFTKIPARRVGYWLSNLFLSVFDNEFLGDLYVPRSGVLTGKDALFVRNWYEPIFNKIGFNLKDHMEMLSKNPKWIPITNGGSFRKWYGNLYNIVNLENNGFEIKNLENNNHRLRNPKYYFKHGVNWTLNMSDGFCVRESPGGVLFGNGSRTFFPSKNDFKYLSCLFNSKVVSQILDLYNPTTNFVNKDISSIPVIYIECYNNINRIYDIVYNISKADWNSYETSWAFERFPLLNQSFSLSQAYQRWQKEVTDNFFQLHENEEELNRIFIEIYGLQDEMNPEVALKDITILEKELDRKVLEEDEIVLRKQGLGISKLEKSLPVVPKDYSLPINKAEVISQFISYAVGCMMGRYRLDKPGLHIAHPNPTSEEICTYEYNGGEFTIDDDGIIPLMPRDSSFVDNASDRLIDFLRVALGSDTLTENINFIEASLDKDIETYFIKDFWKDHLARYQRTPIYWLFESKKGAFQCITYMHRMNPYTVETIRTKYLLPHIESLNNLIIEMESRAASLTTQERRQLQKLQKDVEECMEYLERLHAVADEQIDFDLDDGVVVNHAKFGDVVRKLR